MDWSRPTPHAAEKSFVTKHISVQNYNSLIRVWSCFCMLSWQPDQAGSVDVADIAGAAVMFLQT